MTWWLESSSNNEISYIKFCELSASSIYPPAGFESGGPHKFLLFAAEYHLAYFLCRKSHSDSR